jgi:hypothetical protein
MQNPKTTFSALPENMSLTRLSKIEMALIDPAFAPPIPSIPGRVTPL